MPQAMRDGDFSVVTTALQDPLDARRVRRPNVTSSPVPRKSDSDEPLR